MMYIIGLGNPIDENYAGTRHNIGFDVLFHMIPKDQFEYDKYSSCLRTKITLAGKDVEIILPQLYMNNSGSVIPFISGLTDAFLNGDVLVIHDEIDIPFGSIKISHGSSDGGHNGVRSIIKKIGHNNFARLRIGVAPCVDGVIRKPEGEGMTASFVLKKFTPEEREALDSVLLDKAVMVIRSWVKDGVEKTANLIN